MLKAQTQNEAAVLESLACDRAMKPFVPQFMGCVERDGRTYIKAGPRRNPGPLFFPLRNGDQFVGAFMGGVVLNSGSAKLIGGMQDHEQPPLWRSEDIPNRLWDVNTSPQRWDHTKHLLELGQHKIF